ncbi:MAG: RHS repeat domain-containing protein [Chlorobiales bacterium]
MKTALMFFISWLWVADVLDAQYVIYAYQARQEGHFFTPNGLVSESIYKNLNECYRFTYQDASKKRLLKVERLFRGELSDELSQLNASKVTFKYDQNGRLIEKAQFSAAGKPQSLVRLRYKQGQLVEESLYDGGNKLFSKTRFRYDAAGRLIETEFLDEKNRRQNTSLGYATERIEYDSKGNPTRIAWYDHFGDLSRKTYTRYDDKGNAVELRHIFFPDTTEVEIHKFQFDDAGRWTEKIETDSKNTSFRKTLRRYDALGNLIEESTFDNLGRLVDNAVEIAKTVIDYRENRKVRERSYNAQNILRTDVQFGEFGQVLERAQYASDGTLLEIKRNQYDSFGNLIEERFFKHDNKQKEIPVETRRYEKGKLIQKIKYDKSGKPL